MKDVRTRSIGAMLATVAGPAVDRPRVQRALASLHLLLERRWAVYLAVDVLLFFYVLIIALVGGGEARALWIGGVLLPSVILGIIVLSDAIDLDRRAGSLDLALSAPGGCDLFDRRVAVACGALAAQDVLVVLVTWTLTLEQPFPLLPALLHVALLVALLGAIALFWAVRLRSAGAVAFASLVSVGALLPWLFRPPMPHPTDEGTGFLAWPVREGFVSDTLVLGVTAGLLYLYARRRLNRPETLLT